MPLDGRRQHYEIFSLTEAQMIYVRTSLIDVSIVTTTRVVSISSNSINYSEIKKATHTHTHTHTHTNTHARTRACMHEHTYAHAHECARVHTHTHKHTHHFESIINKHAAGIHGNYVNEFARLSTSQGPRTN
jgi:carbohydrate-binding DOMON domain-containing protein